MTNQCLNKLVDSGTFVYLSFSCQYIVRLQRGPLWGRWPIRGPGNESPPWCSHEWRQQCVCVFLNSLLQRTDAGSVCVYKHETIQIYRIGKQTVRTDSFSQSAKVNFSWHMSGEFLLITNTKQSVKFVCIYFIRPIVTCSS